MESVNHRQNIGFRIIKALAHTLCGSVNRPFYEAKQIFTASSWPELTA